VPEQDKGQEALHAAKKILLKKLMKVSSPARRQQLPRPSRRFQKALITAKARLSLQSRRKEAIRSSISNKKSLKKHCLAKGTCAKAKSLQKLIQALPKAVSRKIAKRFVPGKKKTKFEKEGRSTTIKR